MEYLPININLFKKKILIVGGGKVALHKLKTLVNYTKAIRVSALKIDLAIKKIVNDCRDEKYSPQVLEQADLVYACTDNQALNKQIKKDANARGLLVNVADDPENCDFISPAVYKSGKMSVAVSSNATDVKKAIAWRDKIKDIFND